MLCKSEGKLRCNKWVFVCDGIKFNFYKGVDWIYCEWLIVLRVGRVKILRDKFLGG